MPCISMNEKEKDKKKRSVFPSRERRLSCKRFVTLLLSSDKSAAKLSHCVDSLSKVAHPYSSCNSVARNLVQRTSQKFCGTTLACHGAHDEKLRWSAR